MSKQQTEKDDALLKAMVQDAVRQSERRHHPCFVGFLDEREQDLVQNLMEQTGIENYMLWGGYPAAERVVFGAFPDDILPSAEMFPLLPITAEYRPQDTLGHRDFLGALMALGVERSTIGDILTEEGRCVFFLREELKSYVMTQICKVGSVGVTLREGAQEPYPAGRKVRPISAVVSALRADCIVAVCTGQSREKAKNLILAGSVAVNDRLCQSPSDQLTEGVRISVRGTGKFRLTEAGRLTKKGRVGITIEKYIS